MLFVLQHDQFFIDTVEYAYSIDSLASSHPIDVTVETPADISSVFDAISYDKVRTSCLACNWNATEVVYDRVLRFFKCCMNLLEKKTFCKDSMLVHVHVSDINRQLIN